MDDRGRMREEKRDRTDERGEMRENGGKGGRREEG